MKTKFLYLIPVFFFVILSACSKKDDAINKELPTLSNLEAAALAVNLNVSDMANWMSYVSDAKPINELSIPGTHDSGARHEPVSGTAKTQDLSILAQLQAGVRFLDIRCRHYQDAFVIHHGAIYQHLNFDDVLQACKQFLAANPSETIVMSVKQEHTAEGNSRTFPEEFQRYVNKDQALWYLNPGIPAIGDVRGKIVLFRRFGSPEAHGIDASHDWADKATFTIQNSNYRVRVQDEYQVSNNDTKIQRISNLFQESLQADGTQPTLYVNFASGYRQILGIIPNIPDVSNAINPWLNNYFTSAQAGRYGIIPMDFVRADATLKIVQTNF